MSLNWNIQNVRDYMDIAPGGEANADGSTTYKNGGEGVKTWVIIMFSMAVGMGGITEKNAAEWWARAHLFEKLNGAMMHLGGEEYFLTVEDIQRRIGLTVNVSPETATKWRKRIFEDAYSNAVKWAEVELRNLSSVEA